MRTTAKILAASLLSLAGVSADQAATFAGRPAFVADLLRGLDRLPAGFMTAPTEVALMSRICTGFQFISNIFLIDCAACFGSVSKAKWC